MDPDIDQLKVMLTPWMRNDSWHSGTRDDVQRFHRAVFKAVEKWGPIGPVTLRRAMFELSAQLEPEMDSSEREALVEAWATRADVICEYIHDTET